MVTELTRWLGDRFELGGGGPADAVGNDMADVSCRRTATRRVQLLELLTKLGWGESRLSVLAHLGGSRETVTQLDVVKPA